MGPCWGVCLDFARRQFAEGTQHYCNNLELIAEGLEVQTVAYDTITEGHWNAHLIFIRPVDGFCRKQFLGERFAESAARGNLFNVEANTASPVLHRYADTVLDLNPLCHTSMALRVVAPKKRISPLPTKAEHAESFRKDSFLHSECAANLPIGQVCGE